MGDIIGKILGVIIAFMLCIISPVIVTIMADNMEDRRTIFNETTQFIDEVIDVGTITEAQMKDFYYGVSSYGPVCSVTVYRYIRTVQQDANGDNHTTYIPQDVSTQTYPVKFNQGDLVKVTVEATGYTGAQEIAYNILGHALKPIEFSLSGRVR